MRGDNRKVRLGQVFRYTDKLFQAEQIAARFAVCSAKWMRLIFERDLFLFRVSKSEYWLELGARSNLLYELF
ncbi:MAG: hypothetical protein ACK521_05785 [bacterium]